MLSPKRVKHRKVQRRIKRRISGMAQTRTTVDFGDYGLLATEAGFITNRQIEAARIAMTRHVKRGGKYWIRVFPDMPYTKKPAETRMGKGKGAPEAWVAPIKTGTIMFELAGVSRELAVGALTRASSKLPLATKIVSRPDVE